MSGAVNSTGPGAEGMSRWGGDLRGVTAQSGAVRLPTCPHPAARKRLLAQTMLWREWGLSGQCHLALRVTLKDGQQSLRCNDGHSQLRANVCALRVYRLVIQEARCKTLLYSVRF